MTPAVAESVRAQRSTTAGQLTAGARRAAAHWSHEARLLRSIAAEAVEDGVHAAKRTYTVAVRRVEDANVATMREFRTSGGRCERRLMGRRVMQAREHPSSPFALVVGQLVDGKRRRQTRADCQIVLRGLRCSRRTRRRAMRCRTRRSPMGAGSAR